MYTLRRFHGARFERLNAIIDALEGHITTYVNLIGSASLPFPEVCDMYSLPGTACRAEGHPDARLFPATGPIDEAEAFVEERTRELFDIGAGYSVSSQPHSATQANQAAFRAVLGDDGGPVAALSLTDGGHISHRFGLPSAARFVPMHVGPAGIDYDAVEHDVCRHRPAMIIAGGTSYTRSIDYARLRAIADQVESHLHADLAHTAPFVATGHHPPALPFADSVTIDLSKNLRGPRGGILVYRDTHAPRMRRAVFPLLQSSPDQNGLLAKAACLGLWPAGSLRSYAGRMIELARALGGHLAYSLGPPVFGGTDTHLLLFDLSRLRIDGREAEAALESAQILVNRNLVPGDTHPPSAPAGVRLGTTTLAILGYTDADVKALGDVIVTVLRGERSDRDVIEHLLETYQRPLINTASERSS